MLKMKDFLLVVVVGYAIYQIGWVDGWTGVNIFLLIAGSGYVRSGFCRKAEKGQGGRAA